ncbi:MAG: hypothetical protein J4G03_01715 [Gemmatimonadetes bacterium]|nr:hypothetical protein [Gemmatimonadota bacterium]
MAIEIRQEFTVPSSVDTVWEVLTDPDAVVSCLPGARLRGKIGDRVYSGEIGVRAGPVVAVFAGILRFDELDKSKRRARMTGSGKARAIGRIDLAMSSFLSEASTGGTQVRILQSLKLRGRIGLIGSSGFARPAADALFGRFAKNLRTKVAERERRSADGDEISGGRV